MLRFFFFLLFLLFAFGCIFVFLLFATAPSRYNFLIIGSDQRGEERARSDVLMLVSVPKSNKKPISIITLPRDTLIQHPDYGMQKITHFYAFGQRIESDIFGNTLLTTTVVEDLLNIHIHGTFEVTFEGFQNIVDFLGGVDTSSGHLNGEQALEVVRNRFREGGDFARTKDQREILLSLGQKIRNYSQFRRTYSYIQIQPFSRIRILKSEVLHFGIAFFLTHWRQFPNVDVHEDVLPGAGKNIYTSEFDAELYYWVLDMDGLEMLKKNYLR